MKKLRVYQFRKLVIGGNMENTQTLGSEIAYNAMGHLLEQRYQHYQRYSWDVSSLVEALCIINAAAKAAVLEENNDTPAME